MSVAGKWRRITRKVRLCFATKGNYPWVQLAGHAGGFKAGVDPNWILKLANAYEKAALIVLQSDVLVAHVPRYGGTTTSEGQEFVQMENLLAGFVDARVMDCKIGVRTFLEEDVASKSLRKDLLQKMMELDPHAPTPEERERGITKLRYMQYRETLSSTLELGFRLEAVRVGGESDKKLKTVRTRDEVLARFRYFIQSRADVKEQFCRQLDVLREALAASAFFKTHEVVGSSLLFVYDATGRVNLKMIDFGKTIPRENPLHTERWDAATLNHADGYMLGFENLVSVFRDV